MPVQENTLVIGLICFAVAAILWRYKKLPRGIAWFAGATAFFIWFAFPALPAALAGKAATSTPWLVALLVALIFGGAAFFFETLLAHRYHPVGTPFLLTIFAVAAGTTYAAWPQIEHRSARMLPKASAALGRTFSQIRSRQATHAATAAASSHQATVLLTVAAIVIVVFFVLLHRVHSRRGAVRAAAPVLRPGQGPMALLRGQFGAPKPYRGTPGIGNFGPGPGNAPMPAGKRR